MTRLPYPGQDESTWGDILNNFLRVEHNEDGTLKSSGSLSEKLNTSDLDTQTAAHVSSGVSATRQALDDRFASKTIYRSQPSGSSNPPGEVIVVGTSARVVPSAGTAGIIGGGHVNYENVIGGNTATINTGAGNIPSNWPTFTTPPSWSFIWGGYDNVVNGWACQVHGYHNGIEEGANHCTISGGSAHRIPANAIYGTIGGGTANIVSNSGSTVSGGSTNIASGVQSTVAGGLTNTASGSQSAIGGGSSNTASGTGTVVAGGRSNQATAADTTVTGGLSNQATAQYAVVNGGYTNIASGIGAQVEGGLNNTASGNYATASGRYAVSPHYGGRAHASGRFAADGDAQALDLLYRNQSTSATSVSLFLDGLGTRAIIPADTTWTVKALTVARCLATGESAGYEHTLVVERIGTATPTILTTTANALTSEDAAAWNLVFTTGSDGSFRITATGEASKTIRWVSRLTIVSVSS